jgi:hypothetical protein
VNNAFGTHAMTNLESIPELAKQVLEFLLRLAVSLKADGDIEPVRKLEHGGPHCRKNL